MSCVHAAHMQGDVLQTKTTNKTSNNNSNGGNSIQKNGQSSDEHIQNA